MGFRKIIFKIKNDEMRYGTWHKGGHAKGIHATGHTNVWAQGCRWSCSVGAPFLGNCVIIQTRVLRIKNHMFWVLVIPLCNLIPIRNALCQSTLSCSSHNLIFLLLTLSLNCRLNRWSIWLQWAPFLGNCVIIPTWVLRIKKPYVLGTCHSLVRDCSN